MPERYIDPRSILNSEKSNGPELLSLRDADTFDKPTIARVYNLFALNGMDFDIGQKAPHAEAVAFVLKEKGVDAQNKGTLLIVTLPADAQNSSIRFRGKIGEYLGLYFKYKKIIASYKNKK